MIIVKRDEEIKRKEEKEKERKKPNENPGFIISWQQGMIEGSSHSTFGKEENFPKCQ